jgi:hypothetical protein
VKEITADFISENF